MKTIKAYLKYITVFLSLLILAQGCTVYRSQGVTIDQAVIDGKKVELVTNQDRVVKYKRIESDDGVYYGVSKVKKDYVRTPISVDHVKTVRPLNPTATILMNIPTLLVLMLASAFASGECCY